MSLKSYYFRWLVENLPRYDQMLVLGMLVWLHLRHHLPLPRVDPESPAWWSTPVFFVIGLVGFSYAYLSSWWTELQVRWFNLILWSELRWKK